MLFARHLAGDDVEWTAKQPHFLDKPMRPERIDPRCVKRSNPRELISPFPTDQGSQTQSPAPQPLAGFCLAHTSPRGALVKRRPAKNSTPGFANPVTGLTRAAGGVLFWAEQSAAVAFKPNPSGLSECTTPDRVHEPRKSGRGSLAGFGF